MRAYTSVYRANHCPSASADPRVSRALETFSTGEEGSLREFPPRRGVPPGGKNSFFFFFFYPERTGQPAATKWGEKRFRWISNRGGIVGQSARLIGLDESTSTNDQGRTFHEFRARPCPSHFSRTQGEDSKTKVAGRGSERKDGMKEGSTGCWETPIKRTVTQSFNLIAARTRVHLVQPRSRQRPRPRFPRSG